MENINRVIGKNLTILRKNAKLTQLELAEKLKYSDKAISKWENGESMPNIEILLNLATFYGITLNDLTTPMEKAIKNKHVTNPNKLIISLLAISVVWLLATVLFVYSNIIFQKNAWIVFVWAVPVSCIVGLVFNSLWGIRRNNFIIISIMLWSLLASLYLQFLDYNAYMIFILGAPVQLSIFLWANLKKHPKIKKSK